MRWFSIAVSLDVFTTPRSTDHLRYNVKYYPVLQFSSVFFSVSCDVLSCFLCYLFNCFFLFVGSGFILEYFYLPITSNSAAAINVWNEGASADTSQLYLPEVGIVTASSTTWLSFEAVRCKGKQNEKWWWESESGSNEQRGMSKRCSAYIYTIHTHSHISTYECM